MTGGYAWMRSNRRIRAFGSGSRLLRDLKAVSAGTEWPTLITRSCQVFAVGAS